MSLCGFPSLSWLYQPELAIIWNKSKSWTHKRQTGTVWNHREASKMSLENTSRASVSAEQLFTLLCPIYINIAIRFITMVLNRLFSSVFRMYTSFWIHSHHRIHINHMNCNWHLRIIWKMHANYRQHANGNWCMCSEYIINTPISDRRRFSTFMEFLVEPTNYTNTFEFHPWFYQSADNCRFAW